MYKKNTIELWRNISLYKQTSVCDNGVPFNRIDRAAVSKHLTDYIIQLNGLENIQNYAKTAHKP